MNTRIAPSYEARSNMSDSRRDDSPPVVAPSRPSMSISSILNDDSAGPAPSRRLSSPLQARSPEAIASSSLRKPLPPPSFASGSGTSGQPPRKRMSSTALPPPIDAGRERSNGFASDQDDDDESVEHAGSRSKRHSVSSRSASPQASRKPATTNGNGAQHAPEKKERRPVVRAEAEEDYQPSKSSSLKKPRVSAASWANPSAAEAEDAAATTFASRRPSAVAPATAGEGSAAPAKRRKLKLVSKAHAGSDLEAEENIALWAPALEQYREEAYKRREALDAAYGLLEDGQDERVAVNLSTGYLRRYDAILREEDRIEDERQRHELANRKKLEKKHAKERADREKREAERAKKDGSGKRSLDREAEKRKQEELDDELLAAAGDSSPPPDAVFVKKAPSKKSKKKAKPKPLEEQSPAPALGADELDSDDAMPLANFYVPVEAAAPAPSKKSKKASAPYVATPIPSELGDDDGAESMDVDLQGELVGSSRAVSPELDLSSPHFGPGYTETGHVILDPRREKALEEAHRKVWSLIARRDIPKVYRTVQLSYTNKTTYWRRISQVVQREAKRAVVRNTKTTKDVQMRSRKIMREMLVFWRRNEKEEREQRKKAEKEAVERAKKEEEMREAKRQARKLNFLITQTELYSHFVGSKLKTSEAEESEETAGSSKIIDSKTPADVPSIVPAVSGERQIDQDGNLKELDFDDDDESNLRAHAMRNAEEAVNAAKAKAQQFDQNAAEERRRNEALLMGDGGEDGGRRIEEKDLGKAFDSDDMNFQNPTSMGQMDLKQPKMLTAQLKEYQLKGLNWLANLYEQGINGILADEMGLGKTVQSISLMAYLAEVHDIWGPFLVIAPASTLHNWQQEITRFVPALKALPYWGNVKDRAVLRKFWNKKQMAYNKDAPFHVLITSYQLVVSDEKYFNRVKWQYMVLDEAQAIKSSSSNRWKTLLGFNCRNRLLLTGTPVQNSMQELWALLHFIMPSLFDSHDEFSEWFSKDIESHAENKGTLNEHQLRRLHMILKPFMLRRIKKNVQNELGDKIEIDLYCDMSARQRVLYRGLRSHVSIAELMDKASNLHDEAGLKSLMNLVMQFRKVCNHPELFERADVEAPFAFAESAQSGSLTREGDSLYCPDSTRNPISVTIPKIMYHEGGLLSVPGATSRAGFDTQHLNSLCNIWRTHHIETSFAEGRSTFSALSLMKVSPFEAQQAFHGGGLENALRKLASEQALAEHGSSLFDKDLSVSSIKPFAYVRKPMPSFATIAPEFGLVPLDEVARDLQVHSVLASPSKRSLVKASVAPPIEMICSDRSFAMKQESLKTDPLASTALFGLPGMRAESDDDLKMVRTLLPALPPRGLISAATNDQLPASGMQVPQMNKLIVDSSKLARLDSLLRELKAGGHRVLIYFQMTKMIDLMEEFLVYRQYKYLRLDGASKISDRRDMVTDWQTK